MVGIYITEDCPNLTKEQAAELLKLDAKTLKNKLTWLINYSELCYIPVRKDKKLTSEHKREFEELAVMCAEIYKKVRDYYVENKIDNTYNNDMDFMRMMIDFEYLNCELSYQNNQQLDLAEAIKTYSNDKKVIESIVYGINKSAKKRFYDVYSANKMPEEWNRVRDEVDAVYNKLLEDLGLAELASVPTQPGDN